MERYTQCLPADLTYELALRLAWTDLRVVCEGLEEFRLYHDPHHRLWRELYHRDLSTSTQLISMDEYFAGKARIDGLSTKPDKIADTVSELIHVGYDVPLRHLIPLMAETSEAYIHSPMFVASAFEAGHLSTVELLCQFYPQDHWSVYLAEAIKSRSLDVINYLLVRLKPEETHEVHWLLDDAAVTGNVALFDRLFQYCVDRGVVVNYSRYLNTALMSRYTDLATKMMAELGPFSRDELSDMLARVHHVAVLQLLIPLMGGLDNIPPEHIMRVGMRDGHLDYIVHAWNRGASPTHTDLRNISKCSDPAVHNWVVHNIHQEQYEDLIHWVLHHHPDLVQIYLDALTQPIGRHRHEDLLSWAVAKADVKVLKALLYHPYINFDRHEVQSHIERNGLSRDCTELMIEYLSA